jgi:hypothetical protein
MADSSPWKDSKTARAIGAAGSSLSQSGQQEIDDSRNEAASNIHAVSYKRGGKVRKTGLARLHKGEYVVPRNKVRKVKRAMRRSGR